MPALDDVEILVVEDNAQDAEMTIRALRKGNFLNELHWVKDGVEALEFVRCTGAYASRKPIAGIKLILLDIKMPRLGGLDVLRELRMGGTTAEVAERLGKSSHTIHSHIKAACSKIGCSGRVAAVTYAAAQGWLD